MQGGFVVSVFLVWRCLFFLCVCVSCIQVLQDDRFSRGSYGSSTSNSIVKCVLMNGCTEAVC